METNFSDRESDHLGPWLKRVFVQFLQGETDSVIKI